MKMFRLRTSWNYQLTALLQRRLVATVFYHVLTEKCPKRNEFDNSVVPTSSIPDLECEESSFAQEINITKLGHSFFS
jgi:hypothetical protein